MNIMSVIDNTDKGLRVYYSSFPNATYTNADNVGKFKAFCSDNYESDNEELKKDLDNNEYTLTTFDIDDDDDDATNLFPLNSDISDQDQREKEIFNIIKYCSIHGKPPKDKLYTKPNDYTPFNIDNEQKYNCSLFQFTDNTFFHILEEYEKWKLTKSQRIQFPSRTRWRGDILKLNEKQKKQKDYHNIELKINDALHELIVLSKPFKQTKKYEQNTLFNRDFTSLLIDAYHRYCIMTEIMDIENTIQKHIFTYSQLYWQVTRNRNNSAIFESTNRIKTFRLISNQSQSELKEKYKNKLKESKNGKTITATLVINGKIISNCFKGNTAIKEYNNIIFKFMSSHKFYWCLAEQKKITFFKSAFKTYNDAICGPLTLKMINNKNMKKINDNIFVFWMYIWSMSNVVKTYMQSGDIKIPLQIDLVIIPADNNNKNIDNISERFNIHNQKFETVICDPTNIDSIRQKLESIFMKCSIKMKKKGRIVIIVDRRSRHEYFKDKNFDRIYGYKPLMKYCQIDKKYEIINAIWNTSTYLLPPPPTHGKIQNIGAKNNCDLFVFTYFIRKKSQFSELFNHKEEKEEKRNNDNNIPVNGTHIQQTSSNTAQFDDSTIAESIAESFTTVDTLDVVRPQGFKTKKAQEMFQKMYSLHQKNQLTSVKLHELLQQVQAELAGVVIPTLNTKLNSRKNHRSRALTVTNLQEVTEFQTLQSHIIQVAMARKLDSVVNMYVFYNGGYFRFEPWDLVRILPQLFHVNRINNFSNMINDFKKYHDKLWELDDEIWIKYNEIYLKSMHSTKQKVNTEELGTDPNDRNIIKNYCKWDKKRYNNSINHIHNEDIKNNDIEMKYDDNINIINNYENVKEIRLKCALNEFIEWKSKGKEKGIKATIGMIVKTIKNNDYKQLLNLDNKLWSIMCIEYDNKIEKVSEKKNMEIDKLLKYIYKHKIYPYTIQLIGGFFKICNGTENKIDERMIELSLKLSEFLEWIDNSGSSSKLRGLARDTSKEIAMNLKQLHKKKGNGFKISNINNNEYGIAFKETGVFAGWYIKQVNGEDVSRMAKWEFELFLNNIYNDINIEKLKKYRIKFIYPDRTLSISAYSSKKKINM